MPAVLAVLVLVASACGDDYDEADTTVPTTSPGSTSTPVDTTQETSTTTAAPTTTTTTTAVANQLAGMPPVLDRTNVYAGAGPGALSAAVSGALSRVYVPTNEAGTVAVVDPATFTVIETYQLGDLVQHVVPSWDLGVLYAAVSGSSRLVPFDPATALPGEAMRVDAPYNLYFTPDGSRAVVMAERRNRIDYYDLATWEQVHSVNVPCDGPNHADWSIDGRWFLVTCEFSNQMLQVDTTTGDVLTVFDVPGRPQDVRLGPDGTRFYIAALGRGGLTVLSAETLEEINFIPTGAGTHSVYPSRDASLLYVANRNAGSVSVVEAATEEVVDTWTIPGGGSPDMGGISAAGDQLWLSGRYHDEVYVWDTSSGELLARIPVPGGPHGLAVFPQPGRYSLGHTGNFR